MGSIDARPRERPYNPEADKAESRLKLLARYRAQVRYQNVTRIDLRKQWRQVQGLTPSATIPFRWNPSNADLSAWDTITPKPPPACSVPYVALQMWVMDDRAPFRKPGLREYVHDLEAFVVNTMHLLDATDAGKAAPWACEYVHHDVEPLAPGCVSKTFRGVVAETSLKPRERQLEPVSRQITLEASLSHGVVESESGECLVARAVYPPSGEYGRFDDWEEVRRLAYATIDKEVESMRRELRGRYPHQRPGTRGDRDLDDLFAYLFLRATHCDVSTREGKARNQRLRKLSKMLEIAYPVA